MDIKTAVTSKDWQRGAWTVRVATINPPGHSASAMCRYDPGEKDGPESAESLGAYNRAWREAVEKVKALALGQDAEVKPTA